MTTLNYTEQLVVEHCCNCGMAFAMASGPAASAVDCAETWERRPDAFRPAAGGTPFQPRPQSSPADVEAAVTATAAGERPAPAALSPAGAGQPASDGDCSPAVASGRADEPKPGGVNPSYLAEVPAGQELRALSPAGHPADHLANLLREAAYGIRMLAGTRETDLGRDYWLRVAADLDVATSGLPKEL